MPLFVWLVGRVIVCLFDCVVIIGVVVCVDCYFIRLFVHSLDCVCVACMIVGGCVRVAVCVVCVFSGVLMCVGSGCCVVLRWVSLPLCVSDLGYVCVDC